MCRFWGLPLPERRKLAEKDVTFSQHLSFTCPACLQKKDPSLTVWNAHRWVQESEADDAKNSSDAQISARSLALPSGCPGGSLQRSRSFKQSDHKLLLHITSHTRNGNEGLIKNRAKARRLYSGEQHFSGHEVGSQINHIHIRGRI